MKQCHNRSLKHEQRPPQWHLPCLFDVNMGTDSDLNPEAIASLAQDRSEWRQFVVACSAAE